MAIEDELAARYVDLWWRARTDLETAKAMLKDFGDEMRVLGLPDGYYVMLALSTWTNDATASERGVGIFGSERKWWSCKAVRDRDQARLADSIREALGNNSSHRRN